MKKRIGLNPVVNVSLALVALATFGVSGPVLAAETIDVIVQSEGAPDSVARWVGSVGGRVKYRYKNVAAIAVSIPSDKLAALHAVTGVKHVERDHVIALNNPETRDAGLPQTTGVGKRESHHWKKGDRRGQDGSKRGDGFSNPSYTGATQIWNQTGGGSGSIIAVVDTGVVRNFVLQDAVVGAPGFPEGYNSVPDGVTATDPANHWHGTFVSGVIAGSGVLEISDPNDTLYRAFVTQAPGLAPSTPGGLLTVPLMGQAPNSKIYPVKVFPQDGSDTPTSALLDGLDHVLTLKKTGVLDIDIINLSLGDRSLADGFGVIDLFVDELTKANMLVVIGAANSGPMPLSVGTPGTSFSGITVAAVDYPITSRVMYEWRGLETFGFPGVGRVMRPKDEIRIVNFSSRGPLADGRAGVHIAALGTWNFGVTPDDAVMWGVGTSFATPTVAGVAALLNAYWESKGNETSPEIIKNVLLRSANDHLVGEPWRADTAQGYGVVDAAGAFNALKRKLYVAPKPLDSGTLEPNILGSCERGTVQRWQSHKISLDAAEVYDAVLEIGDKTSHITIDISDMEISDNSANAFWPNAIQIMVQSGKRSAFYETLNLWWDASMGKNATIEIEDGFWTINGQPVVYQPMEPGLMRISLSGDYVNETRVRCRMKVTRTNGGIDRGALVGEGSITMGESAVVPVQIPAGVTTAQLDLVWQNDWTVFPTSDLDFYIYDADSNLLSTDGATRNAPERIVLNAPTEGTYYILVDGFELYNPDHFKVYLKTE